VLISFALFALLLRRFGIELL